MLRALLYSLVAAYTVGGGSLISTTLSSLDISLSEKTTCIIFILILGVFIYISTRIIDHINKIMFSGKLLAFLLLVAILIPHVSLDHLSYQIKNPNFIWVEFPILLTSFGFHHIIPTLRTYVGSNKRSLRQAIIIVGSLGSSIPFSVFIMDFCDS